MLLFYAVAGIAALATGLALVRPLLAGRAGSESRDAEDAQLYRDQLEEIERDLARGAIGDTEAAGARAEVSRRLLAATARAEAGAALAPAPRTYSALLAGSVVIGAPALALAVYLANGTPGLPDMAFDGRSAPSAVTPPSQQEAEAAVPPMPAVPPSAEGEQFAKLIAQLEEVIKTRPDDVQGHRLLANGYVRLGRHADAWRAYAELIRLVGADNEPELLTQQVEQMIIAADGYVSPEARAVLGEALARIPDNPMVRYYDGLALAQTGDLDGAIGTWERLRADAPEGAPWLGFVDSMLAEARAMQQPQAPRPAAAPATAPPGPDAATVAAAAQMSAEDRQAMIESMVGRLETRLTTDGGTVEEWLRLINAYVQLGRPDDAKRAYGLGRDALGGSTEASFLREQALLLGVATE